jgi:hypothetical protein
MKKDNPLENSPGINIFSNLGMKNEETQIYGRNNIKTHGK